ncbi:hypothetical protein [Halomarina litorea]|uniref:hypothetical protein n=1 Tax=Halomarina litorea TaxID=2961595 RepID=UPI0020C4FCBF|nr:hypothetical protein [Halomarina sp. BCD28]
MVLSNVSEQVMDLNRNLSDKTKVGGGSLLLLLGTVLIAVLAFVLMATAAQVVVGLLGTLLIVVGTLSVGTSGINGRAV